MRLGCWLHIYGIIRKKLNFVYISDTKVSGITPHPLLFLYIYTLQCAIFPCQLFNFCLNFPVVYHHKEPQPSKAWQGDLEVSERRHCCKISIFGVGILILS